LEGGKFQSWTAGDVTFPKAEGVFWHNWSPPVLIMQFSQANQDWKEADVALEYEGGK
jgi:branched-chain amino acid transport system substrate-binding protein